MADPTDQLVEHFFRHESANVIAVLTRAFGLRRIELIEDMVQVAMLEAMTTWRVNGIPDNAAAWMYRVATQRIIDALRREQAFERAVELSGHSVAAQQAIVAHWFEDDQIADSLLRMMFVCCHPAMDLRSQLALTLKTLCGFGIPEVARGLMLPLETVRKRIQRARSKLADLNVAMEIPSLEDAEQRLDAVHNVLYLMFNEGYSTSRGDAPIRDDVCEEAVRLCHLLCESPLALPQTYALFALLLFQAARFDARMDSDGAIVLLEDQDRSLWDVRLIETGQAWLLKSKCERPSVFHLEAAIARLHCVAESVAKTDWISIVNIYRGLIQLRPSPVYVLNQAIAMAHAGDLSAAINQLTSLSGHSEMKNYALFDCATARILELDGRYDAAVTSYRSALDKVSADHERDIIGRRLNDCMRRACCDT